MLSDSHLMDRVKIVQGGTCDHKTCSQSPEVEGQ